VACVYLYLMAGSRVLLLFLDGVGLGPEDPTVNPLARASLPGFHHLTGGPLVAEAAWRPGLAANAAGGTLLALDATLGVGGTPQSGTGQYSLLTGRNGPEQFGRHYGPYVPTALRSTVQTNSLLALASRAGRSVAFANAYPEELFGERPEVPLPHVPRSRFPRRHNAPGHNAPGHNAPPHEAVRLHGPLRAGPPLAALGADVLTRHTEALRTGDAVASEIVNTGWQERLLRDLPDITPRHAGQNLARIVAAHDLTLFAHYSTDTAGHLQDMEAAVAAIELVDEFLGGLFDVLPPDTTVVIASDHGNLEDVRTGHTLNPALCIVTGPGRERIVPKLFSLMDVAPSVLELLSGRAH